MTVPSITPDKVCLSGLDVIALAAQLLRAGEFGIVVADGMESMTRALHLLPKGRTGRKYGSMELLDAMTRDAFDHTPMGELTERRNTSSASAGLSRMSSRPARTSAPPPRSRTGCWRDGPDAGPAAARRPGAAEQAEGHG
jgi:Thiolase, N-terminal domain